MRVLVLGGTCFLGRRVVERLHERGDSVLVVHRGRLEPEEWIPVGHLHTDRRRFADHTAAVAEFAPDAVVERWLRRGAAVLRLPLIYGPHDRQRREDAVLRRLRAHRSHIPIGVGNLLWTRGHVDDLCHRCPRRDRQPGRGRPGGQPRRDTHRHRPCLAHPDPRCRRGRCRVGDRGRRDAARGPGHHRCTGPAPARLRRSRAAAARLVTRRPGDPRQGVGPLASRLSTYRNHLDRCGLGPRRRRSRWNPSLTAQDSAEGGGVGEQGHAQLEDPHQLLGHRQVPEKHHSHAR